MRHLLSIEDLDRSTMERILDRAKSFTEVSEREIKKVPALRGRRVLNLFWEASTRTRSSFELAAKALSADVVNLSSSGSAIEKGESLKDTVQTLSAYRPDLIVIRTPHVGAAHLVARWTDAGVVNAGDGKHEHPTQALLDVYALRDRIGSLEGANIWIVGDVLHSRVARSNIHAFSAMGAKVTVCGPPTLIPRGMESLGCEVQYTLDSTRNWKVAITHPPRIPTKSATTVSTGHISVPARIRGTTNLRTGSARSTARTSGSSATSCTRAWRARASTPSTCWAPRSPSAGRRR